MDNPIRSELADDGTATVAVLGEIDFSNADEVAQGIRDVVAEWSPPTVWVDLRDASFIDSTGLGALIEGYRAVTESEARFVVVNPTEGFRRVLTLTGLCELFGLADPEQDADSGTSFQSTQATGT
ncbi:STAS domain-containing protein [Jidongwangia harbinensis]|uniref:STAS domain-containing protein n=1 Tax=Jidongwangia harbinensis TaxID=2878561 RepID=UPI001CDA4CD3|nr:STAS domain-containing protein [Jidongwangia harbinensis]MCA2214572.1 STAS domain-containing protein [Jidongwangia harbinensis]